MSSDPNREREQRQLQAEQDRKDSGPEKKESAVQAGARRYPEPPFPPQRQDNPGKVQTGTSADV